MILYEPDIWPPRTAFAGTFEGNGHTITGLNINRPTTDYVGLFGYTVNSATIRNVGLVNGNIKGQQYVGGLVGWNDGSISNSYRTGAVNGTGSEVGGLVGYNDGSISNSYSSSSVTGAGDDVGGLVGINDAGSITDSYSAAAQVAYCSARSGSGRMGCDRFLDQMLTRQEVYWVMANLQQRLFLLPGPLVEFQLPFTRLSQERQRGLALGEHWYMLTTVAAQWLRVESAGFTCLSLLGEDEGDTVWGCAYGLL